MQKMKTRNVFAAIGICALISGNQILAQPKPNPDSGAAQPESDAVTMVVHPKPNPDSGAAQPESDAVTMVVHPKPDAVSGATLPVQDTLPSGRNSSGKKSFAERFTIGGYGEAVMTYNMYSDNFGIYSDHEEYKNNQGHGRFDLPHAVTGRPYEYQPSSDTVLYRLQA